MDWTLRDFEIRFGRIAFVLITFIVYIPVFKAGFIFDDISYIVQNPMVHASNGLYRIWFSGEAWDYWPLSYSVFWIEWQMWGENPLGYHVVNLVLHILNGLLLYQLLTRLNFKTALAITLLFLVHPVGVSTVAWIFQTKTTMATLFALSACHTFKTYLEHWKKKDLILTSVMFLLSMLSKSTFVFLPLALGIAIAWHSPSRNFLRKGLVALAPLILISAFLGLFSVLWYPDVTRRPTPTPELVELTADAAAYVGIYLSKVIFPIDLMLVYPDWRKELSPLLRFLPLALAALIVVGAWVLKKRSTVKETAMVLSMYVVLLFPALGFFYISFMKYTPIADHWQYPMYAMVLILTVPMAHSYLLKLSPKAPALIFNLVLLMSSLVTHRYLQAYSSNENLWKDVLSKNPSSILAHTNLGIVEASKGNIDKAVVHYQFALERNPDDLEANINLGAALSEGSDPKLGIQPLMRALRHRNDPVAAYHLGMIHWKLKLYPEAIQLFRTSTEFDPEYVPAYNSWARALLEINKVREAKQVYEASLAHVPESGILHFNMAKVAEALGEMDLANHHFEMASKLGISR